MEGLTNPDKLEALWKQSRVKKIWDDSQNKSSTQLDQYLSQTHPAEDSVSIEDYMSCWCNVIQTPNSPTPQEDHRMPQQCFSEKRDNLDKYNKFINELSVRIECGWPPMDHIPHDEDLLRHTLRTRRKHGKAPRKYKARNFHGWKDSTSQLHPFCWTKSSEEKVKD